VGAALMLWVLGFVLSLCGLFVWLEFGCMFPRSGGEKVYLEAVYRRPRLLATVFFAVQAILLGFTGMLTQLSMADSSSSIWLYCFCVKHTGCSKPYSHSVGRTRNCNRRYCLYNTDTYLPSQMGCSSKQSAWFNQGYHSRFYYRHWLGCLEWQSSQHSRSTCELPPRFQRLSQIWEPIRYCAIQSFELLCRVWFFSYQSLLISQMV
jgi:hypothetical protein